jgi:predicted acylesterase/phospholipase RssA
MTPPHTPSRRPLRSPAGWIASLAVACLFLGGCGASVGTVIELTDDVVFYPFRNWVFLGAFEHDNPWDDEWEELPVKTDMGEVLVGISLSGGGSRSAYFATCVLDELGKRKIQGTDRTYLDEVDFISGVSGGSLAATYYCANWGREGYPAKHDAFFKRMREDMALNFEARAIVRLLLAYWPLLQFTHYDVGNLLGAVWDSNFLDDLTYADLPAEGPVLLVNATCYNNGQKFVFSRQPLPRNALLLEKILGGVSQQGWASSYRLGATMSMQTLGSSIGRVPLSTGVRASAAVPDLLGVVTLEDKLKDRSVHLGDGGIYDNHGFESLIQGMREAVAANPQLPVALVVVDAAGFVNMSEGAGEIDTLAGYASRTLDISWLRAANYAQATYQLAIEKMVREGRLPRPPLYGVISLYDTEGLDEDVDVTGLTADVLDVLRGVPTRFSISSASIEAIEEAAPRVVDRFVRKLKKQYQAVRARIKKAETERQDEERAGEKKRAAAATPRPH